jgi:hypothetical protein
MKSLLVCLHCQAVRPREVATCPNCAPRTASWSSWLRGAIGVAGLSLLGAACNASGLPDTGPGHGDGGVLDGAPADAARTDAAPSDGALTDAALVDGARGDAAVMSCHCPVLAAYGNFPLCDQPPVAPDAQCPGGKPICVTCPPK